MNLYRYATNLPLIKLDPYGKQEQAADASNESKEVSKYEALWIKGKCRCKLADKPQADSLRYVACDGKGNIVVKLLDKGNEATIKLMEGCDTDKCSILHETKHVDHYKMFCPNVCKDAAEGVAVSFQFTPDFVVSECLAHFRHIECLLTLYAAYSKEDKLFDQKSCKERVVEEIVAKYKLMRDRFKCTDEGLPLPPLPMGITP